MGLHYNPNVEAVLDGSNYILVDRDGVLNEERPDYVKTISELIVF